MLADLERARYPASSLSRQSRRGRDRCERSGSRPGLHADRRARRRGSECRKSLHTPGSSCVRAQGRGRENIFEQINTKEEPTYLHHDQQGSTRLLTSSTGTVTGAYTYDAYGNTTGHTGTATTPLGYDGQYTSSDTGLIYLRARTYDPATAQFMSVDPMVGVTRAPYNYAGDNPVNSGDPTGLCNANPFSESFWTQGNCVSESPLNPIPYYETEIESYENGCGYFASVAHGLEGALAGTALFAGGEGADEADAGLTGIEDALAGLKPGNSPGVYTVDSPEELQQVYDELSHGGTPASSSYPGQEVKLPDGTRVGIRETSKSGGPAIDINGGQYRIHVAE